MRADEKNKDSTLHSFSLKLHVDNTLSCKFEHEIAPPKFESSTLMSLKFLCEGLNRYVGPPRTQNYFCFQPTPAIFSISPHQHKNDK
jgi:hypothetical protein